MTSNQPQLRTFAGAAAAPFSPIKGMPLRVSLAALVLLFANAATAATAAAALLSGSPSGYRVSPASELLAAEPLQVITAPFEVPGFVGEMKGFASRTALSGDWAVICAPSDGIAGIPAAGTASIFRQGKTGWELVQFIEAPDPLNFGRFCDAVEMGKDVLAIRAAQTLAGAREEPVVYLYELQAGRWNLVQRFAANPESSSEGFGTGLAVAGDRVAISDVYSRTFDGGLLPGAVFIYRRAPTGWFLQQTLHAPAPAEEPGFGYRLAMTSGRLFVTDPGYFDSGVGRAYQFDLDEHRQFALHSELLPPEPTQPRGRFGESIAYDGGVLAIGEPRFAFDDGGGEGRVLVYGIGKAATLGSQSVLPMDVLRSDTPLVRDFGQSVAVLRGRIAAAGHLPYDPGDVLLDPQISQLEVFVPTGEGWDREKIYALDAFPTRQPQVRLDNGRIFYPASETQGDRRCAVLRTLETPSEVAADSPDVEFCPPYQNLAGSFTRTLEPHGDGFLAGFDFGPWPSGPAPLLAYAPDCNGGFELRQSYLPPEPFERWWSVTAPSSSDALIAHIADEQLVVLEDLADGSYRSMPVGRPPERDDNRYHRVALSGDHMLAAASFHEGSQNSRTYAIDAFQLVGGAWQWRARLDASVAAPRDQYMAPLTLRMQGDTAISNTETGATFLQRTAQGWVAVSSISAGDEGRLYLRAFDGTRAVFSNVFSFLPSSAKRVEVYRKANTGGWQLETVLDPPADVPSTNFGISAAIDGDRIAVGSRRIRLPGSLLAPAAIHIFQLGPTGASYISKLEAPNAGTNAATSFAQAVTIRGDRLVVAEPQAPGLYSGDSNAGRIYVLPMPEPAGQSVNGCQATLNLERKLHVSPSAASKPGD